MEKQKQTRLQWNAGTGMVAGIIGGALVALIISLLTGDEIVWLWAIPVGLSIGLAIGVGRQQQSKGA